jgi:hypothetical protein
MPHQWAMTIEKMKLYSEYGATVMPDDACNTCGAKSAAGAKSGGDQE